MAQIKPFLARAGSVLLLAMGAACSDGHLTAARTTPDDAASPAFSMRARSPRDVPEVKIDLPPRARAWDDNPAALADAITDGEGYAVVAFKEPGSARALKTGRRAAVTSGTVRAGIELLERNGAEILDLLDGIGGARVRISPQVAAEIADHPLVDFVEPRQYGHVQAQTTPAGIALVQAPSLWSAATGAGVRIEIIDTGHQQGHPDLPAVPSLNCGGIYGGCDDDATANWHGTHVLGIIAARDNADGVVGAAPGIAPSDIFMYGACDATGRCPTDEVTSGISAGLWTARLMNLSLVQPFDLAQSNAVGQAWSRGIVVVAAAGNNLTNTVTYPAGYANVVGVSGVRSDKTFATTSACGTSSNQGTHVDLAAPMEAYSTVGGSGYATQCGTSMAGAHVSGVAALLMSQNPTWTNQQIVDTLFARAEDLGPAGRDNQFGHGLVRPLRPLPVSTTISGPGTISTAGAHSWQAYPSGGNGSYTYTWEHRPQGTTTWTQVGTGSSYSRTVSAGEAPFELRLTVTSGGLTTVATKAVFVNISQMLSFYVVAPDYAVAGRENHYQVFASGGTGSYTYEWRVSYDNAVVGTSTSFAHYIPAHVSSYDLILKVTSGGSTITRYMPITVVQPVSALIDGASTIPNGGTHTWSAAPSGGNGTYAYSWEYRPQGTTTWTQVGTASSYSRTISADQPYFELRLIVTSAGTTASATQSVSVIPPLSLRVIPPDPVVAGAVNYYHAVASGGTGSYAYEWRVTYPGSPSTVVGTSATLAHYIAADAPSHGLTIKVTSGGSSWTYYMSVSVAQPSSE